MAPQVAVSGAGLVVAVLSMVGNGTFGIFPKLCRREPDPILLNAFLALGILVSSLLTQLLVPLVAEGPWPLAWTLPGGISGALLVVATGGSFVAISLSGLAVAQSTWSCAAILVSFFWGALGPTRGGRGPGAPVHDWTLSVVAVVLLLSGSVVINLAGQLAEGIRRCWRGRQVALWAQQQSGEGPAGDLQQNLVGGIHDSRTSALWSALRGVPPALVVGISGGSILVPSSFVPTELAGLPMLLSFGLSAGALGLLAFVAYWRLYRGRPLSCRPGGELAQELRSEVLLYGTLSGICWNLGNICQIVTLSYLHMPYGVSYPVYQCALVVAGLWGIAAFKEVTDPGQIMVFLGGVGMLVCGVVLLGLFGPGGQGLG